MSEIIEQGDIFFFYRPRVGVEEVRGLDDVQRFFYVFEPDGRDGLRRIVIGRKRLPHPGAHERELGIRIETEHESLATAELFAPAAPASTRRPDRSAAHRPPALSFVSDFPSRDRRRTRATRLAGGSASEVARTTSTGLGSLHPRSEERCNVC
jgi:hypothetical protein